MSSIAGILSNNFDLRERTELLDKMSDSLKNRGPNEEGKLIYPWSALIDCKLHTSKFENYTEPYRFEKYVIIFDGKIYNYDQIKNELINYGYTFSTTTDAELVLKAFHKYKENSFTLLNGTFAFAILNTEDKELYLCRDKIGVNPLFYSLKKNIFAFASRIKTLLLLPEVSSEVDETGLYEIFMLGPAKTNGCAIFKDIKEVLPGTYLHILKDKIISKKYWTLEAKEHKENLLDTIEKTRYLVTDSITKQLDADVPLCTFLSGGLDSSIVSNIASNYFKEKGETLNTFSVDYTDNDKYFESSTFQPNKDSDYIDLISDFIGSNHKNIVLSNESLANALIDSTKAKTLPGFADIDSSLYLFCKNVKKDFTVALSGECADELFGGYPWYFNKDILFKESFPWSSSTDVRYSILKDGVLLNGDEYVHEKYLKTISETSFLQTDTKEEKRMREMFKLNLDWFMQTLLQRNNIMSQENSMEVRAPFCDVRIVEYAYNMPWSIKALNGREKGILRKAFEKELPTEIVWRKKSPYPKTHNPVYFDAVCKMMEVVLNDKETPLNEFINKDKIIEFMNNKDALTSPWYGQLMRTPQILAYIIQIYYWIKDNDVKFI